MTCLEETWFDIQATEAALKDLGAPVSAEAAAAVNECVHHHLPSLVHIMTQIRLLSVCSHRPEQVQIQDKRIWVHCQSRNAGLDDVWQLTMQCRLAYQRLGLRLSA